MKKSAIKDIFYGNRGNIDTMNISKDSKNRKIACDIFNEFKEKLSPELLNLHQNLIDALLDNAGDEIDFYFAEGFKLGLVLGIECMEE